MLRFANQIWNLRRSDLPVRPAAATFFADLFLAIALVTAAFGMRSLLSYVGNVLIFATAYPAILAATLISGLRAGAMTLALSMVVFWYAFVPPYYSFAVLNIVDATNLALFFFASSAIIWIGHEYRKTLEELRDERERNHLLMREMQHRSKNGLAVVCALVTQSLRHDPESTKKIVGRLCALRQGEELLVKSATERTTIDKLLRRELGNYDQNRLLLNGPEIFVEGEIVKSLCMIAHELATNAVKYGAWSNDVGRVAISWSMADTVAVLHWVETAGPTPKAVPTSGFGSVLITTLLRQHNGKMETRYEPSGAVFVFDFEL